MLSKILISYLKLYKKYLINFCYILRQYRLMTNKKITLALPYSGILCWHGLGPFVIDKSSLENLSLIFFILWWIITMYQKNNAAIHKTQGLTKWSDNNVNNINDILCPGQSPDPNPAGRVKQRSPPPLKLQLRKYLLQDDLSGPVFTKASVLIDAFKLFWLPKYLLRHLVSFNLSFVKQMLRKKFSTLGVNCVSFHCMCLIWRWLIMCTDFPCINNNNPQYLFTH